MVGNQMAATGTEGRQKGCDIVFGIVEGVEVVGDVVGSIVVVRAVVGDKVVEVVTVVVGKGGSQNSVSKFCTFCCEVRCIMWQHLEEHVCIIEVSLKRHMVEMLHFNFGYVPPSTV